MTDKKRRSPWILLAWPASLLVVLWVIWVSGYVCWQIRINRAIAQVKREPAKYARDPFYSDPELAQIGSRGFQRMTQELDDALARGEADLAFALTSGLATLWHSANPSTFGYFSVRINDVPPAIPSIELMEAILTEHRIQWDERQERIAPPWEWWRGTLRSR